MESRCGGKTKVPGFTQPVKRCRPTAVRTVPKRRRDLVSFPDCWDRTATQRCNCKTKCQNYPCNNPRNLCGCPTKYECRCGTQRKVCGKTVDNCDYVPGANYVSGPSGITNGPSMSDVEKTGLQMAIETILKLSCAVRRQVRSG